MRHSIALLSRVSKPRATPPQPPRPTFQRPPPPPPPQTPKIASNAANTGEVSRFIRRPRPLLYAIGFAVVTVAGAILGAQLKTTKQELDKRNEIETAAQEITAIPEAVTESIQPTTVLTESKDLLAKPSGLSDDAANNIEVARQIALLENRRSFLDRQRQTLERKIENLRERKARKDAMEARRTKEVREQ